MTIARSDAHEHAIEVVSQRRRIRPPQVAPQVTPQVKFLLKALIGTIVEMTIPEKPNSRLQCYRLK
jgi:hypothetical protein